MEDKEFQRLVLAEKYIEVLKQEVSKLKIEIGTLTSEKDELEYKLSIKESTSTKLSSEEKTTIKTTEYYRQMKLQIDAQRKRIKMLQDDNESLICKIFQIEKSVNKKEV